MRLVRRTVKRWISLRSTPISSSVSERLMLLTPSIFLKASSVDGSRLSAPSMSAMRSRSTTLRLIGVAVNSSTWSAMLRSNCWVRLDLKLRKL